MKLDYQKLSFSSDSTTFSPPCGFAMSSSPGTFQDLEYTMRAEKRVEGRDVADLLRQLQHVIQLLALPIRAQVRLVEDDCTRIRQMSSAFRILHLRVRNEPAIPIAADQMRALDQLNSHLERLSQNHAQTLCSELAMRQSMMWRKTRLLARDALIRFGWALELPPFNWKHSLVYNGAWHENPHL